MKIKAMIQNAKAFVDHPVRYTQDVLRRRYKACREEAYNEAKKWERIPELRALYTVQEYAVKLTSWSAVLSYSAALSFLTGLYGFDDALMQSGLAMMLTHALVLLPVTMAMIAYGMMIFYLPACVLRNEHDAVKHLKAVTIGLFAIMLLNPVIQLMPVYTWHLAFFETPYVPLSTVLAWTSILGVSLGLLTMTACIMTYAVWSFIVFVQRLFQHGGGAE